MTGSALIVRLRERSALRGCLLALLALCVAAFWLRTAHISASLPYPQHVHEVYIAQSAANILTTGNYYPTNFNKPSLPTYLVAAAMSVGFIGTEHDLGVGRSSDIDIREDLGDVSYPFHTLPGVVEKARWLFALLSVVAMAAGGVVAYQLLGRPGALILAPLVLALSPFFFDMSHSYLNVDIVGTCFVALGVAAVLQGASRPCPTLRELAVIPAICVGLAAGSKYTYGLVLFSVMLAIYLFMERGRRLQATVIAITTAGLSFLAVAPYSVIALPDFVNGLARQAHHYATGHPSYEADPGLDQFAYYASSLVSDFGVAGLVLCLIGLISAALSDWRRTLVLVSFPVALFALFSAQRVHFLRNILPVFPWVAVFIACGICFLHGRLMRVAWIRRIEIRGLQRAIGVVGCLGLFALGLNVPLGKFAAQMEVAGESRVRAVAWIKKHVATDATVIVPEELQLDTRPLASSGYPIRVMEFKALDTAQSIDSLMAEIPGPVFVLVPWWVADPRFSDGAKDKAAALNEALMRARLVPLADFSLQRGVLLSSPMSQRYSGTRSLGGFPGRNPGFSIASVPSRNYAQ